MSACSCSSYPVPDEAWTDNGEVPPPVESRVLLIDMDMKCPRHGEGTDHWRQTQDHARELAKRLGLS